MAIFLSDCLDHFYKAKKNLFHFIWLQTLYTLFHCLDPLTPFQTSVILRTLIPSILFSNYIFLTNCLTFPTFHAAKYCLKYFYVSNICLKQVCPVHIVDNSNALSKMIHEEERSSSWLGMATIKRCIFKRHLKQVSTETWRVTKNGMPFQCIIEGILQTLGIEQEKK